MPAGQSKRTTITTRPTTAFISRWMKARREDRTREPISRSRFDARERADEEMCSVRGRRRRAELSVLWRWLREQSLRRDSGRGRRDARGKIVRRRGGERERHGIA